MKKRIAQICDKIIISGVIGLVVFTPIAIGSVHVRAFSMMELIVIGLVLTWMIKLLCLRDESVEESLSDRQDLVCKMPKSRFGFVKTPLNVPFLIFVGILLFQTVPLPMSAIRFLSPETYEIYSNYLPDKEDHNLKSEIRNPKSETAPLTLGGEDRVEKRMTISINPHSTRIELFKILSYVAVFFLIVNNFKTHREINYLLFSIILVGCFEAVYGFCEYSNGNRNILFAPRKYNIDRLAATYVNPNHLAGLLEMIIPIAVSFSICSLTIKDHPEESSFRAKLSLLSSRKNFTNILLLISIALLVGALFLSQSRMGVMGFLISIWIFGIYILKKFYKRNELVFVVGGLSGVLFFASWVGLNSLYERFSTMNELTIEGRTDIWKDTGGILRDFLILGTGKGTFIDIYKKYKTIPDELTYDHAHNDYLELLSEMGLSGLAVTVIGGGFFTYKIISQLTKRRDAYVRNISVGLLCSLTAIIVHSTTDFNMFITANALLFSIILALLTLTAHLKNTEKGRNVLQPSAFSLQPSAHALRKPLYAFIIILTIFFSIPVLRTCMADVYYRKAKMLAESSQENIPLSIPYMQKCITLDKSNSVYHFELGRMFLQLTKTQSNPDEFKRNAILAEEQFENAITSNPCYS
ncbi:MAG: O-antigen ligase family protein, partial [Planctomycetes bacterium]|nr:O-antigen ligase family protein [Planctomycetota bacterium]